MAKLTVNDEKPEIYTVGDVMPKVEGYYVGSHEGKFGTLHDFKMEGGGLFSVKANRDLDNKMRQVPLRVYVWIEFVGMKEVGKGNAMKVFKVEYDNSIKF